MIRAKAFTRRLTLIGMAVAVVALLSASAASATTNVPVWTSGGTPLNFGKEVAFKGTSSTGVDLKFTSAGVEYWIQCEKSSGEGVVENYASGKPGTLTANPKAGSVKLQNCYVVQIGESWTQLGHNNCKVPSEIETKLGAGELTNTPYASGGLKLSSMSFSFNITNCPELVNPNITFSVTATNITGEEGPGALPGEVIFPEGTPVTLFGGMVNGEIHFALQVNDTGSTPIVIGQEEIVAPSNPGHHYWYIGGGMRKGEGPRTLVTPGTPLSITGGTNTLNIETIIGGVSLTIACSGSGKASGTVENPAGEQDGIASATFGFTGCTVTKPSACTVEGGGFSTVPMSGALLPVETWPPLGFKGVTTKLAEMTITGSKCPAALKALSTLTGTLAVSPYLNPSLPERWRIFKEDNKGGTIKFRGQNATVSGDLTVEHEGEIVTLN